ncbi:hypothetical protein NA57DRAFT_56141 [Rhizodiscina lignyota]|uniref:Uncharacterized protein n=1 Tax=Rhizodiscina lignyota TaxID=1504668 RepID=A0A9P4M5T7_9PEZI|nr:hypothetical protein NA57DRAFT_56141 [Rhizodiscina lignyota]
MCRVEETTYIYPDGERRIGRRPRFCRRSNGSSLCHDHERENMGTIMVQTEPGLDDDRNLPSPASSNFPPTPESGTNVEVRAPATVGRQPSTRDHHGKRRIDTSTIRVRIRKDSPKWESRPGHHHSASSSSSAAASSSGIPAYVSPTTMQPETLSFDVPPELSRAGPDSPTERLRRRLRPVITSAPQPNPSHDSTSASSSSRSRQLHSNGREGQEPRSSDPEGRRAREEANRQERQRRREVRRGKEPEQSGPTRTALSAEQEAEERARDEFAMREYERVQAREELRRQHREREREREERERRERELRDAQTQQAQSAPSRARRHSVHYADIADDFQSMRVSDGSSTTEGIRRREELLRQINDRRAAEEASQRDRTFETRQRIHQLEAEQRAEEERQRRLVELRAREAQQQQRQSYPQQPYPNYQTEFRFPAGSQARPSSAGTRRYSGNWTAASYHSDPAPESGRGWHNEDVSPRAPRRTNSTRQAPVLARQPSNHHLRQSVSYTSANIPANVEVRRPGSSSSNTVPWIHDIEARRVRGEQVLENARARADAAEREARARVASQRLGYAVEQYPEGSPEWWRYHYPGRHSQLSEFQHIAGNNVDVAVQVLADRNNLGRYRRGFSLQLHKSPRSTAAAFHQQQPTPSPSRFSINFRHELIPPGTKWVASSKMADFTIKPPASGVLDPDSPTSNKRDAPSYELLWNVVGRLRGDVWGLQKQLEEMSGRMDTFEQRLSSVEESTFTPPETPTSTSARDEPKSMLEQFLETYKTQPPRDSAIGGKEPESAFTVSPSTTKAPDAGQTAKVENLLGPAALLHERLEGVVGRLERFEARQQKTAEASTPLVHRMGSGQSKQSSSLWPELKYPFVDLNFTKARSQNTGAKHFTSTPVNADIDARIRKIQQDCVSILEERTELGKTASFSSSKLPQRRLVRENNEAVTTKTPTRSSANAINSQPPPYASSRPRVVFGRPSVPAPSKPVSPPSLTSSPWAKYSGPKSSPSPFVTSAKAVASDMHTYSFKGSRNMYEFFKEKAAESSAES